MRSNTGTAVVAGLLTLTLAACSRQASHDSPAGTDPGALPAFSPKTFFGPTVAGRFYPADKKELDGMLRGFLDAATRQPVDLGPDRRLVGLIVPHAGYVFSGAVAARSWALAAKSGDFRTVIVLGPSHHRSRSTISTVDREAYRTPVGDVPIALDIVAKLVADPSHLVQVDPDVLAPEHSVDVQIPFVRTALPSARVVPLVVPFLPPDRLDAFAGVLFDLLSRDPTALVVASSDLSHFFDDATAQTLDRQIEQEIVAGDTASLLVHHDERRGPCGVAPIAVLLAYEKRLGPSAKTVALQMLNSGDTSEGDKSRVVGYLAAVVTAPK